jgi:hypothetical protein
MGMVSNIVAVPKFLKICPSCLLVFTNKVKREAVLLVGVLCGPFASKNVQDRREKEAMVKR